MLAVPQKFKVRTITQTESLTLQQMAIAVGFTWPAPLPPLLPNHLNGAGLGFVIIPNELLSIVPLSMPAFTTHKHQPPDFVLLTYEQAVAIFKQNKTLGNELGIPDMETINPKDFAELKEEPETMLRRPSVLDTFQPPEGMFLPVLLIMQLEKQLEEAGDANAHLADRLEAVAKEIGRLEGRLGCRDEQIEELLDQLNNAYDEAVRKEKEDPNAVSIVTEDPKPTGDNVNPTNNPMLGD